MVAGTIYETSNYSALEIIKYNSTFNVDVRFLSTGFECRTSSGNIRKGEVRDRLFPSITGVGYFGIAGIENPSMHASYVTWVNMIKRCYDVITQRISPTYIGCTVCDEWHNFQNFAVWYDKNYVKGCQLDKDIKVKGNKVYGPLTCSFVTHRENSSDAHAKSYSFIDPNGNFVDVVNIMLITEKLGMSASGFYSLASGSQSSYKGWTIRNKNEAHK